MKYDEFAKMHMDRNDNAMSPRWKTCNKFYGDPEQVHEQNESGKSMEDNRNDLNFIRFRILTFSSSGVCLFFLLS